MEPSEKEEVRARTDIAALVGRYTTLRQTGRTFKGLCPFHQEKTPSFTVDPERGRWHCFGACSTGGDVFTFLMRAEGLTFIEAAERLAEMAGVTLTRTGRSGAGDREAAERARSERDRLFAANDLALRYFGESFRRVRMAQDYALERKLAHDTQQAWALGWAPGGFTDEGWGTLATFLKRSGVHPADAETAGLVFRSKTVENAWVDKFWGRLIFPIWDAQERVVGFGGRLLLPIPNAPKYLNSPETPVFSKSKILYGLHRARRAIQDTNKVVVVEGYLDVVQAHQAGFSNVVATLGTALTEEHVRLLHRYTKNVILSFDADEAGVRAALKAAALFPQEGDDDANGATLRVLALPPGDDPDSLLARGDVAAFRKAMDGAVSVPEFRLRALRARADVSSEEGKIAFLRDALPVVAEVRSVLGRDLLLRRLTPYHPAYASGGGRAEESLRAELDGYLSRRGNNRNEGTAGGKGYAAGSNGGGRPVTLRGERVLPANGSRAAAEAPPSDEEWAAISADGDYADLPVPVPPDPAATRPNGSGANGNNSIATGNVSGRAVARAEQALVRALLSPEWLPVVQDRVRPELFANERTARLVAALLPLVSGPAAAPGEAVNQLADPDLAEHAGALLLSDGGEPLSSQHNLGEQVLDDSLRLLHQAARAREMRKIRTQSDGGGEGMPAGDDELLRRWQEMARPMRRGNPDGDDA